MRCRAADFSIMKDKFLNVLGVRIYAVNIPIILNRIDELISRNGKGYITVTGVHGVIESQKNVLIQKAHNNSFLTVPDGMPLVYMGKLCRFSSISRCYGPELMIAIMKHGVNRSYSHFFYGGKEGVAEKLKVIMEDRFPGIRIVGTYTPPFRSLYDEEKKELIELLKEKRPNIFWVGLSTPKQELFMFEFANLLETNVMLGVGAAFDIHTGRISSAPSFMQKLALEWFYRFIQEPKRLGRRYFINNPLFLFKIASQKLNIRKFEIME
jgi:N-acetylglucosaminyldiphosphoundecaprenol N-acetyl-beta-D-mannosaminyltransferase